MQTTDKLLEIVRSHYLRSLGRETTGTVLPITKTDPLSRYLSLSPSPISFFGRLLKPPPLEVLTRMPSFGGYRCPIDIYYLVLVLSVFIASPLS